MNLLDRVIRGALKLRYLLLGGAITGGVTLNKVGQEYCCCIRMNVLLKRIHNFQRYEEWKDGLPDFKWLNDVLPDNEQWNRFSNDLKTMQNSIRDTIEIGESDQPIDQLALCDYGILMFFICLRSSIEATE